MYKTFFPSANQQYRNGAMQNNLERNTGKWSLYKLCDKGQKKGSGSEKDIYYFIIN
jgi:hypothetical protein